MSCLAIINSKHFDLGFRGSKLATTSNIRKAAVCIDVIKMGWDSTPGENIDRITDLAE